MGILAGIAVWAIKFASTGILERALGSLDKIGDNNTEVSKELIKSELDARKGAREIRLATAGFWEMRLISGVIAGCFTLHLVAVTLDTVFKLGMKIPAFPKPFDEWEGMILLSFFGVQVGFKALSTLAAIFIGRR